MSFSFGVTCICWQYMSAQDFLGLRHHLYTLFHQLYVNLSQLFPVYSNSCLWLSESHPPQLANPIFFSRVFIWTLISLFLCVSLFFFSLSFFFSFSLSIVHPCPRSWRLWSSLRPFPPVSSQTLSLIFSSQITLISSFLLYSCPYSCSSCLP